MELPASLCRAGTEFTLSDDLTVTASQPAVERLADADAKGQVRYRLSSAPADGALVLTYEGAIDHGLSDQKEEYTRGFRETRGIVGTEGVYLSGDSGWVPRFNDGLVRFVMQVQLPEQWHIISQGNGTSRDDQGVAHWDSERSGRANPPGGRSAAALQRRGRCRGGPRVLACTRMTRWPASTWMRRPSIWKCIAN